MGSTPDSKRRLDIQVRQETLTTIPGQPVMLQLPLVPSYALTTVEGKNRATIVFLNYHGLQSMMHILWTSNDYVISCLRWYVHIPITGYTRRRPLAYGTTSLDALKEFLHSGNYMCSQAELRILCSCIYVAYRLWIYLMKFFMPGNPLASMQ